MKQLKSLTGTQHFQSSRKFELTNAADRPGGEGGDHPHDKFAGLPPKNAGECSSRNERKPQWPHRVKTTFSPGSASG
jgi:hypothetical protein